MLHVNLTEILPLTAGFSKPYHSMCYISNWQSSIDRDCKYATYVRQYFSSWNNQQTVLYCNWTKKSMKGKRAQLNACTMCYNHQFLLDICKPSTWIIQRYKGVWNSLTFVLPFPIHSVLTVLLCSMNMLLSLAFLWTLSPNLCSPVLMNYFILYKADCRAYTCVGASSGLVRLLSRWCQKDTCSPAPCHLFLSAADISLCLCGCTNLEPCRNAARMCDS